MKVKDLLAGKPNAIICSIGPDDKVGDAIRELCANRIGAMLVEDDQDRPIGIITERDVLRLANEDLPGFADRRIGDVMTSNLICGLLEDNIRYVMQVMTQNKIRHLPIIENNKVVGMVSVGDVIKSSLEEIQVENHWLKDYLHLRGEI